MAVARLGPFLLPPPSSPPSFPTREVLVGYLAALSNEEIEIMLEARAHAIQGKSVHQHGLRVEQLFIVDTAPLLSREPGIVSGTSLMATQSRQAMKTRMQLLWCAPLLY